MKSGPHQYKKWLFRLAILVGSLGLSLSLIPTSPPKSKPSQANTAAAAPQTKTVNWEDLVPPGWDPLKHFEGRNVGAVEEGSSAEAAMIKEMREIWDNAPTRSDLEGAQIRLPGYVVPLEVTKAGQVTQFLLVPYFGACIHSPPPPANQIILVTLKSPGSWGAMDAVWVTGPLSTKRQDSSMGVSGYSIEAERVDSYESGPR